MPAESQTLLEEGVLLDTIQIVAQGQFLEAELVQHLTQAPFPARSPAQNLADLQAQIAANHKGVLELRRLVNQWGLKTVQCYMQYLQDHAAASVQRAIARLCDGQCLHRIFSLPLDNGSQIQVALTLTPDPAQATIDFTGTSTQQNNNFNAPVAIAKAVVLYVFRTLVDEDIPLNAGGLRPLRIRIPEGCFLNPLPPAAVVAGNVETSQAIANALYGALGVMAASQGTMNNLTFGNEHYQYYETLAGGAGAGPTYAGADAVQTHMTNSRLTDPEVLESRFPILVEEFSLRSNSGGQGQYAGGNGLIRRLRFREQMLATLLSSSRHIAPFGLAGGQPGARGHNWVERLGGPTQALAGTASVELNAGDVLGIATPGGGGYGKIEQSPLKPT
jgi:5-oxoprolinase (ATP-hydrolysing)